MVFQDAWVQIDYYYRYIMPLIPFNAKYAIKIKSDWEAAHLCFQFSESKGELSGEYCYTKARHSARAIREAQMQWCFLKSLENVEVQGYLTTDSDDPNTIVIGTEFSIQIPWDKIQQKWNADKFLWYPGCDE